MLHLTLSALGSHVERGWNGLETHHMKLRHPPADRQYLESTHRYSHTRYWILREHMDPVHRLSVCRHLYRPESQGAPDRWVVRCPPLSLVFASVAQGLMRYRLPVQSIEYQHPRSKS